MFMGRFQYEPSQGPAQYRRTVYAFWRRSAAPTFLFDAAQRRVCEVRPRRTNTPLHALTLLNDLSFLEASRELARQAVEEEADGEARIAWMCRAILARQPQPEELRVLLRELERAQQHYATAADDADQLLAFGQPEIRPTENRQEIAAYLVVASLLFNLDEAITHE